MRGETPLNDFKVLHTTVRDQAVDNLKEAILSGFLQPGQKLVEKQLCEMCGVSRTSIREALRILEGEKLIVHLPHKGLRVATPTLAEAHQIYEARAVLEALLGRYAAQNAVRSDVVALHASVDAFEKAVKAKDLRHMVTTADTFYAIFFRIAARPIISDMLQSLQARISTLRATSMSNPSRGPHSAREMRDMARAIEKGDANGAADACTRHVREAANAAQVNLVKFAHTKEDSGPARARPKAKRRKAAASR
jgi:GntR family transcriptional regulator, trigonelline degradation regulator